MANTVNQAIQPALNTYDQGLSTIAGAVGNGNQFNQQVGLGQNIQNTSIQQPFLGGGQAMNAYLDALGVSYQTAAASSGFQGTQGMNNVYQNMGFTGAGQSSGSGGYGQFKGMSAAQYAMQNPNAVALGQGAGGLPDEQERLRDIQDNQTAIKNIQSNPNLTAQQIDQQVGYLKAAIDSLNGTETMQEQYKYNPSLFQQNYGTLSSPATSATYSTPSSASDILSRFQNAPGYQAALQSGLQGINSSAAAQGLLGSGGQGQALTKFAGNYAQQGYQNYLGQLANAAGIGETAAGNTVNADTSLANSQIAGNSQMTSAQIGAAASLEAAKAKTQAGNFQIPGLTVVGF